MIARMIETETAIVVTGEDMDTIEVEGQLVREPGVDTTDLPGWWTGVTEVVPIWMKVTGGTEEGEMMIGGRREEEIEIGITGATTTGKRREGKEKEKKRKIDDPTGTTELDQLKESLTMTEALYTRMTDLTDQVDLAPEQAQYLTTVNRTRVMVTGTSGQYYSNNRHCYNSSTCSSSR